MNWLEELPNDCPPEEARKPNSEIYYRLTEEVEAKEKDFYSCKKLYPSIKFNLDECTIRAVSIFDNLEGILEIKKLPNHKDKHIKRLLLNDDAGLILKTFKNGHHSWWINKIFDPISAIINDE